MIVINWMNCNQGFIMGVLTLVYVVATWFIYRSNTKSANAATKQLEEMKNSQIQNVKIQLFEKRNDVYVNLNNWQDVAEKVFSNTVTIPGTNSLFSADNVFKIMVYNDINDLKLKNLSENIERLIILRDPESKEQVDILLEERLYHIIQSFGTIKKRICLAKHLFSNIYFKPIEDFVDAFFNTAVHVSAVNLQNLNVALLALKKANILEQMENDLNLLGGSTLCPTPKPTTNPPS